MLKRIHWNSILTIIVCAVQIALGQNLYWESKTVIHSANEKEIKSVSWYRSRMIKQESDNTAMIFRLDKEIIYQIDNEKKEYSEISFKEFEERMKKMNNALEEKMDKMKKQLESMPPEQRQMVEKMMGKQTIGTDNSKSIDVTQTKEKKTISGFLCTKYVLKDSGKEVGTLWTTNNVPNFKSMKKDFKEFGERMAAQMPLKGSQYAEALKKVEGFPIQTTIGSMTTTVLKIEKKSLPESEFEIPAGYKKVEPPNVGSDVEE